MTVLRRYVATVAFLFLTGACAVADAQSVRTTSAATTELATLASGETTRLVGVAVEGSKVALDFALERFDVFTADATVTIHGEGGSTQVLPAPANRYFRGTVAGEVGSHVFLALLEDGSVQGIVNRGDGSLGFIGSEEAPQRLGEGPLTVREVSPLFLAASGAAARSCDGTGDLDRRSQIVRDVIDGRGPQSWVSSASAPLPTRTASLAIETDFELFSLFAGNTTNETNYIANLIGYDSAVAYVPEIATALEVSSVSLWTTAADPWTFFTGPSANAPTFCALTEFGNYWAAHHASTVRTTAHFMSGKNMGGGIAWIGVLCSADFSFALVDMGLVCPGLPATGNIGGGYGFTASLQGTFNVNNPTLMWDVYAVAHEIGHNFGSPHSHCYKTANVLDPIDQCWSSEPNCYAGTPSLPGLPGQGTGTIMSYCHQISPGYTNIGLTFGTGFGFGNHPEREAAAMNTFVSSVVGGSCMQLAGPAIASIAPATGGIAGGQSVTITGARFANGATVTIGGAAATSVVVQNATTITATTPPHAAGTVTVVVNNPAVSGVSNGNAMLLNGYVYTAVPPAPIVTAVAPASGPLAGGTVVTITGNNFANGATATFAGAAPVATTFVNATTLTATTPANTAGTKSVTVTNPDASNGSLTNGFFYADAGTATDFFTVTPCRMVDTRGATGPLGGPALAASSTRLFTLAKNPNVCGIPATAKALSLNVTADAATAAGTLALYPGNAFPLGTSTVSYKAGVTRANNVVMELATDGTGTIGVQNASTGTVQLIIDVNGYFQ